MLDQRQGGLKGRDVRQDLVYVGVPCTNFTVRHTFEPLSTSPCGRLGSHSPPPSTDKPPPPADTDSGAVISERGTVETVTRRDAMRRDVT